MALQFGNGTLRLTTRQAYQLHGVLKQDLKTVFSSVVKNMGSTLGACGDVNRNVMGPAGVCGPAEHTHTLTAAVGGKGVGDVGQQHKITAASGHSSIRAQQDELAAALAPDLFEHSSLQHVWDWARPGSSCGIFQSRTAASNSLGGIHSHTGSHHRPAQLAQQAWTMQRCQKLSEVVVTSTTAVLDHAAGPTDTHM